ncbi:MAG: hypothetical protein V4463_07465 [Pseudomonadota bacterium]
MKARDPEQDATLRAIVAALRAGGASFSTIAAMFNRIGLPSRQGGRWYGATIGRIAAGPDCPPGPPRGRRETPVLDRICQ